MTDNDRLLLADKLANMERRIGDMELVLDRLMAALRSTHRLNLTIQCRMCRSLATLEMWPNEEPDEELAVRLEAEGRADLAKSVRSKPGFILTPHTAFEDGKHVPCMNRRLR